MYEPYIRVWPKRVSDPIHDLGDLRDLFTERRVHELNVVDLNREWQSLPPHQIQFTVVSMPEVMLVEVTSLVLLHHCLHSVECALLHAGISWEECYAVSRISYVLVAVSQVMDK